MEQYTWRERMSKIDLYNGDCLEVMDKLIAEGVVVDAIITDPPYRVITGGKNGDKGKPSGILTANKQLMSNIPPFKEWIKRCYDILSNDSHIYIMTNMLNLKELLDEVENAGFYTHNLLVWEKSNATPNKWYMKNCEYVIFAKKGKAKFINNCGSKTVHKVKSNKQTLHPTEKPIELMEMYILNSSLQDQTILDPFMGSGTTGVACKNINRHFIGIELDENYFNIAQERIK
jgi:site-specific DNA-methyltransferase (adenine-specific)